MTEATAVDEPIGPIDLPQLIEQGRQTVVAVNNLRAAVERNRRSQDRRALAKLVLFLMLVAVAVDNRVQIWQLQQQLCPIVTSTITRPGEAKPITQHGRDVEQSAIELAGRLGCEVLPR